MAIDQYRFGLADCKIALRTAAGTYGTALDVKAVTDLLVEVQTVEAELTGDDGIVDTHARGIKGIVTVKFGFSSLAPYALITGETHESSASGNERIRFGKFSPPYIAIAGQIKATNTSGDSHIYIPKCKLMSGFQLGGRYGEYITPELRFTAVVDDNDDKIFHIVDHVAVTTVVIPAVLN